MQRIIPLISKTWTETNSDSKYSLYKRVKLISLVNIMNTPDSVVSPFLSYVSVFYKNVILSNSR